jgi:hypothetical protein
MLCEAGAEAEGKTITDFFLITIFHFFESNFYLSEAAGEDSIVHAPDFLFPRLSNSASTLSVGCFRCVALRCLESETWKKKASFTSQTDFPQKSLLTRNM